MYEHRFKTSVSNGDHIYDERGNRSWNGMLFSSKKALLLNYYVLGTIFGILTNGRQNIGDFLQNNVMINFGIN
jgi:hypothetical protein